MTALLSYRTDLFERADPHGDWLRYVSANSIDLTTIYPHVGILGVTGAEFFEGHRFDFSENGTPAAVIEVIGDDAETVVDLCAWLVDQPQQFATALGHADGLGVWQVQNPATYFGGRPLLVHKTPLAWLQANCRGVVILNERSAPRWLAAAPGPIAGQDVAHARSIARMLAGYFDPESILAPVKARRIAA